MTFEISRRGFLAGIIAAGCAPVIVRASSLMGIKPVLGYDNPHRFEVIASAYEQYLRRAMLETKEILMANVMNFGSGAIKYSLVHGKGVVHSEYIHPVNLLLVRA